ncbi:MAG: RodZ domain-containing protein [Betaproteobacteria bacterium]
MSSEAKPPAEEVAVETAGQRLTAARRSQGLSLGDIARQLKISVRQVEALEHDDYSIFAGAVFVRGFLRNYAKLLHLDPDALVAAATHPMSMPEAEPTGFEQTYASSGASERPRVVLVSGVLVALVIIAVVLLASNAARESHEPTAANDALAPGSHPSTTIPADSSTGPSPAPGSQSRGAEAPDGPVAKMQENSASPADVRSPASTESAPQAPASAASKVPAKPAASAADAAASAGKTPAHERRAAELKSPSERTNATRNDATAPVSSEAANAEPGKSDARALDNRRAGASADAPGVVEPTAKSLTMGVGPAQLKLVFEGDSWVRVTDATGATILSRMNPSGSERLVRGTPPFTLVVGNAQNVKLIYHDKDVDLQPHTRVDVARITLE